MTNQQAFELINAGPGLVGLKLGVAAGLASWTACLVPLLLGWAWWRGDAASRRELLQMVLAVLFALAAGAVVAALWPQPGPPVLHLGRQYLSGADSASLPSQHVVLFWSLGLAALASRRHALLGFPMLALGLIVGWCRVYLGVQFPLDVLAAFAPALLGVLAARALRRPLAGASARLLDAYDRVEKVSRTGPHASHRD
jgi:undecaprenyl-diphosphatase